MSTFFQVFIRQFQQTYLIVALPLNNSVTTEDKDLVIFNIILIKIKCLMGKALFI